MPNDKQNNAPATQPAPANPQSGNLDDSLEPTAESTAAPGLESSQIQDAAPPSKAKGIRGMPFMSHLYLIIFALMVIIGGSVVFISMKAAKPQTTTTKATSLTDQQISSLKGNTTLVGDSKQTLDVQSNSIFEGQILARGDVNVAGSLKIGGPLSIPSISVGGNGSFGQIGISGPLNAAGDTTLQSNLSVQKNLTVGGSASFGSLNVSSLSITTLQLKGDISLNQHVITSGGVPTRTTGTGVGGGGTASVSGSDTAGTINISTGGSPPAGCFITINFAKSFGSTPHIVISPSNSSAATIQYYTTNRSPAGFSVCTANAPAAGTTYIYDYLVIN